MVGKEENVRQTYILDKTKIRNSWQIRGI